MHDQLKHHFESLNFKMQKSLIEFIMDINRRKPVNLNKSTLSHLDGKNTLKHTKEKLKLCVKKYRLNTSFGPLSSTKISN